MKTERADNAKPGTRLIRWTVGSMIVCAVVFIAVLKAADTKTEPGELRAGTQAEIFDLRPATKADIAALRAESAEREKRITDLFVGGMFLLVGIVVATALLGGAPAPDRWGRWRA